MVLLLAAQELPGPEEMEVAEAEKAMAYLELHPVFVEQRARAGVPPEAA